MTPAKPVAERPSAVVQAEERVTAAKQKWDKQRAALEAAFRKQYEEQEQSRPTANRGTLEELKRRFAAQSPQQESTPHRAAREAIDAYLKRATPSTACHRGSAPENRDSW